MANIQQAELGLILVTNRMRKRELLAQVDRVMPCAALEALIAPRALEGRSRRPPFSVYPTLLVHFVQ